METLRELKKEIKKFIKTNKKWLDPAYPKWITDGHLDPNIFTLEYFYVIIFDKLVSQQFRTNPEEYDVAEQNLYRIFINYIKDEFEPLTDWNGEVITRNELMLR
jgi:hypothetical protein